MADAGFDLQSYIDWIQASRAMGLPAQHGRPSVETTHPSVREPTSHHTSLLLPAGSYR